MPDEQQVTSGELPSPPPGVPTEVAPARSRRRLIVALALVLALMAGVAVVAIISGGEEGSIGQITTTAGVFTISDVRLVDRYPGNCSDTDPGCLRPQPGRRLLMVFFDAEPGAELEGLAPPGEDLAFVTHSAGRETVSASGADFGDEPFSYVVFVPVTSARDFELMWPGNEPIPLEI